MDLKSDGKNARSSPSVEPVWDQGAVRGDETGASGTTGGGRGISGGDWLLYGAVAAVALAVGTVNAFSMAYDLARRGGVYDLRMPFVWEMSSVAVVVLATPIIFMTVRRIRAATTWPMRLALGLLGIVAFSALHIVGMVLLRKFLLALAGGSYDFGFSAETVLYEFRKDILTSFMIGGPFWLLESRREDAQARLIAGAPQPETTAPGGLGGPHMVWLRDGATRIRIEPRDIVWIASAGNYVEYAMASGEIHLIRGTLASTETQLKRFNIARVHRTRLANLNRVTGVENRPSGDFELTFDTGQTVTGSRRYRASVEPVDRAAIRPA
jgi:hypothetical protein